MEKYKTINQAIQDPNLILITEDIITQKELNQMYLNYKTLPKTKKRYSDYYSDLFLGHNVPEMYVYMKEKIKNDGYDEEYQPLAENLVLSEPDLYYKQEEFNAGETNICYILGHSGSGKSMMARTLEGEDIDHIELDDLLLTKDHFTMDELKDYSDMFYSFFQGEGAKYYIGIDDRTDLPKEEYEDKVFLDFVQFASEYAKQHPDKKFIIDGIWLYLYFDDPSVFDDYAVFIKGTSFLKSKIRTLKRESKRDKEELKDRKDMFGRESRNYLLDEGKINAYRLYFSDKPETIVRTESKDSDKKDEDVVNELKAINTCYVNEDADGITAIKEKAEANTSISKWNKARIISECLSALHDLKK